MHTSQQIPATVWAARETEIARYLADLCNDEFGPNEKFYRDRASDVIAMAHSAPPAAVAPKPDPAADIIAKTIAQIEANSARHAADKARIDNDKRVRFLTAECERTRRPAITGYGKAGFDQIVAYQRAPEAMRHARAAHLLRARRARLFNGAVIPGALANCAKLRANEKSFLGIESNIAGIDRALENMVA